VALLNPLAGDVFLELKHIAKSDPLKIVHQAVESRKVSFPDDHDSRNPHADTLSDP